MSGKVRITILVENTVNLRGLRAEHGLAFQIQAGPHQLLFDTGQAMRVFFQAWCRTRRAAQDGFEL